MQPELLARSPDHHGIPRGSDGRAGRPEGTTAGADSGCGGHGAGILVAPFASTLSGLIVSRTIFSIGRTAVAACFLIVVADYVQENSRGKWNAFQGVTFGIGSIVAAVVIVGMPKWLLDRGWDVIDAGYATHFLMVGAAGVSALVLALMLRADGPREGVEHEGLWR